MTKDDVFERTGQAYLFLVRPVVNDEVCRHELAPVFAVSADVPDHVIAHLIIGSSWRERLIGLVLAMTRDPGAFSDEMLASLHDVRGFSIVPTCAALAVMSRRELFDSKRLLAGAFDRAVFDGELGWALDSAARYLEGASVSDIELSPNSGQSFVSQVELYDWILDAILGWRTRGSFVNKAIVSLPG